MLDTAQHYIERAGRQIGLSNAEIATLLDSNTDNELAAIADFLTRFTKNVNEHTKTLEAKAA